MPVLAALCDNAVLTWALLACGSAQCLKLLLTLIVKGEWRPSLLLETGGMPSSHAALVSGAAAAIGWQEGLDAPLFATACTVALVVMYDACGVRRMAGVLAERINTLPDTTWLGKDQPPEPLQTNSGHTLAEVLMGGVLGVAVALVGISQVGSTWHLLQMASRLLAKGWGSHPGL